VALLQGDFIRARSLAEEARGIFDATGDQWGSAWALQVLGRLGALQGDNNARALLEAALGAFHVLGDECGIAWSLLELGRASRSELGEDQAGARVEVALALFQHLNSQDGIVSCLEELAYQACEGTTPNAAIRAVRLLGAAEALRERIGAPRPPADASAYERLIATLRERVPSATFADAWQDARSLGLEAAVALAQGA
jgi:hypothetical protein